MRVCGWMGVDVGAGEGERERERGEGRKEQRREPERGRRQGQGNRPTDQQGWKHKFHLSEEVIMIITKSSYYHHTSILIVMFLILHIADYGLIDHWSINGRLTINHQNFFDLVSIVRSSIDKWSIDSRSSSIDCSFIIWLYRSSMGWSLLIYMGPLFDH